MSVGDETDVGGLANLSRDHRELRETVMNVLKEMSHLGGKVDTIISLLQNSKERHDAQDEKVKGLEKSLSDTKEKLNDRILFEAQKSQERLNSLSKIVYIGMGAVGVITAFPAIVKLVEVAGQ